VRKAIDTPSRKTIHSASVRRFRPISIAACLLVLGSLTGGEAGAQSMSQSIGQSGLPIPRFVSLKADRVNLRNGPGTDYPVNWVYRRAGLPVEVVKEFETWRQVRDAEGATGWVLHTLLSGRRTALVVPWERKADKQPALVAVMASDSASSAIVARVEAGVIADLHSCDGRWCRVTIESFRGYVEQKKLWGVYEGERLK
jgi:SH3-like domain-containing protein